MGQMIGGDRENNGLYILEAKVSRESYAIGRKSGKALP